MPKSESLFERLRALAVDGPVVTAHRGHSSEFAENTLAAFRAAAALGCPMQEFDVRSTRDGALVCIHDASLDRTTDAAIQLGPGALVAECTLGSIQRLDAGSWHPVHRAAAHVPTVEEALEVMLPTSIPLIEHKAGTPDAYVAALRQAGRLEQVILQSFDWRFVAAAKRQAPDLAVAVLGPNVEHDQLDAAALEQASECGAGMVHWRARAITGDDVERAHTAGMLVCSYTTDDELGMRGGAALGLDAMCTNVPDRMLALRESGALERRT